MVCVTLLERQICSDTSKMISELKASRGTQGVAYETKVVGTRPDTISHDTVRGQRDYRTYTKRAERQRSEQK